MKYLRMNVFTGVVDAEMETTDQGVIWLNRDESRQDSDFRWMIYGGDRTDWYATLRNGIAARITKRRAAKQSCCGQD